MVLLFILGLLLAALLDVRATRRADRLADRLSDLTHEHAADRERIGDLERCDAEAAVIEAAGVACVAVDQDEPTTPGSAPSNGTTAHACDWES